MYFMNKKCNKSLLYWHKHAQQNHNHSCDCAQTLLSGAKPYKDLQVSMELTCNLFVILPQRALENLERLMKQSGKINTTG